jgi:methionine-rich copper-binding protein CopC
MTIRPKRKIMINLINRSALIAAAGMFNASAVFAHAELVRAIPEAASTVAASPSEITIDFSEAIDLKFSGANLVDSMKINIPTGSATQAKGDDKTLVIPLTTPLATGEYVVSWHNLSKDGHKLKGSFKFTVKP